jgi:hypothetical protein
VLGSIMPMVGRGACGLSYFSGRGSFFGVVICVVGRGGGRASSYLLAICAGRLVSM